MTTKIVVTGSKGRMGQTILLHAKQDPQIEVVDSFDQDESIENHLKRGATIMDFTTHTATPIFAKAAQKAGCPMVIGTTGFSDAERATIVNASKTIPVVLTPNMSVGVNLLFSVTKILCTALKEGFDIEIIEKHHRHKKDSPSGTAVRLVEMIAEVKGRQVLKSTKHGRSGNMGARSGDEIGVHSIRGGDFVGEHTVIFAGDGEVFEITHKANSREIFAKGALVAAKWASKAKPGLYDMFDVLNLRTPQRDA